MEKGGSFHINLILVVACSDVCDFGHLSRAVKLRVDSEVVWVPKWKYRKFGPEWVIDMCGKPQRSMRIRPIEELWDRGNLVATGGFLRKGREIVWLGLL